MLGAGVQRYYELVDAVTARGSAYELRPVQRLIVRWWDDVREGIFATRRQLRSGQPGPGYSVYGPALLGLEVDVLAAITLSHAVSNVTSDGGTSVWTPVADAIGQAVRAELGAVQLRRTNSKEWRRIQRHYKRLTVPIVNRATAAARESLKLHKQFAVHTGSCLLDILCAWASVGPSNKPTGLAFRRRQAKQHGKPVIVLELSPDILQVIEEDHQSRARFHPCYKHMITVPAQWVPANKPNAHGKIEGGYFSLPMPLVKRSQPHQKAAYADADMTPLYDAINTLQSVPLRINTRIYEVQRDLWKQGGNVVGIPHKLNVPLPEHPAGYKPELTIGRWKDVPPEHRDAYKAAASAAIKANIQRKGPRRGYDNMLSFAEELLTEPQFYAPRQACFRFRLYTAPKYLHYQGEDTARSMLEFARYKAPGPAGLRWLRIHAANCYGMDKLSYDERESWTLDHMQHILKCAKSPLDTDWWHQADKGNKPFQFLAACFALADPNGAGAHIPVRRDGTCNGLQHYAALTRDPYTASLVNLTAGHAPNSIYSHIHKRVMSTLRDDAQAGHTLAMLLSMVVTTQIIKQVVMTFYYDVTERGARLQIIQALIKAGIEADKPSNDRADHRSSVDRAAEYLATTVLHAVAAECPAAKAAMDWLKYACREAVSKTGRPFRLTTPDGMPMIQPKDSHTLLRVETATVRLSVQHEDGSGPAPLEKQVRGAAPNTIHMLDAAHMRAFVKAGIPHGIDVLDCHDAAAMHAADVDQGNQLLLSSFVELHRADHLSNFHADVQRRYDIKLDAPPDRGTLDIREVLKSQYAFS